MRETRKTHNRRVFEDLLVNAGQVLGNAGNDSSDRVGRSHLVTVGHLSNNGLPQLFVGLGNSIVDGLKGGSDLFRSSLLGKDARVGSLCLQDDEAQKQGGSGMC